MSRLIQRLSKLSNRTKTLIGIAVIALAVALVPFAPPEGDANNTTGDQATTPTVTINNLLSTKDLNYKTTLSNVDISITGVMEAQKFSDDRKHIGNYTVRVLMVARNSDQTVRGVDYSSLVRLQLADGTLVPPKYITLKPVSLPKSAQTGYIDFPVTTPVSLSTLTLHLGSGVTFAFNT